MQVLTNFWSAWVYLFLYLVQLEALDQSWIKAARLAGSASGHAANSLWLLRGHGSHPLRLEFPEWPLAEAVWSTPCPAVCLAGAGHGRSHLMWAMNCQPHVSPCLTIWLIWLTVFFRLAQKKYSLKWIICYLCFRARKSKSTFSTEVKKWKKQ